MNIIILTVIDPSGSMRARVKVPDNIEVDRVVRALTAQMNLPLTSSYGEPINYTFSRLVNDEEVILDGSKSLFENDVKPDDTLRLQTRIFAGSDFIVRSPSATVLPSLDEGSLPTVRLSQGERKILSQLIVDEVERRFRDVTIEILEVQKATEEDRKRVIEHSQTSIFGRPSGAEQFQCDAFMIMPFRPEFDEVYFNIIEPVFTELKLAIKRGDAFASHQGMIMNEVYSAIYNCKFIVAECTIVNANVYYELGIAHALAKPTILLTQDISSMPFDLRHLRHIVYDKSFTGGKKFQITLQNYINSLLSSIQNQDN